MQHLLRNFLEEVRSIEEKQRMRYVPDIDSLHPPEGWQKSSPMKPPEKAPQKASTAANPLILLLEEE
jgi:hypothetical protein